VLESGAAIDAAMTDMVVPFLGLAGGEATVHESTDHVACNIRITNKFVDHEITIEDGHIIC